MNGLLPSFLASLLLIFVALFARDTLREAKERDEDKGPSGYMWFPVRVWPLILAVGVIGVVVDGVMIVRRWL